MSGIVLVVLLAWSMASPQDRSVADESLSMMAHWKCHVWTEMVEDTESAALHAELGFESGKRFVVAARAGEIDGDEIDRTVPVYISMSLGGPSDDFALGRLYELTTQQAYDQVVTRGKNGVPLAPSDYVMDRDLQSVLAGELIRTGNCAALRAR